MGAASFLYEPGPWEHNYFQRKDNLHISSSLSIDIHLCSVMFMGSGYVFRFQVQRRARNTKEKKKKWNAEGI